MMAVLKFRDGLITGLIGEVDEHQLSLYLSAPHKRPSLHLVLSFFKITDLKEEFPDFL